MKIRGVSNKIVSHQYSENLMKSSEMAKGFSNNRDCGRRRKSRKIQLGV